MKTLLIAGATGLVGRSVLGRALADPRVDLVIAPTRRALRPHRKLRNPVVDFDDLPVDAAWWQVDAAICALGTTRAKAGSAAAFRQVDLDLPRMVARLVRAAGAERFALTSSMGADAKSLFLYTRTKGELEEALRPMAFPSLTIVRPGLLGGEREEVRFGERLAAALLTYAAPILPMALRISPVAQVAHFLIEGALSSGPGTHIVDSAQIARAAAG